jgi:hypothetical protein
MAGDTSILGSLHSVDGEGVVRMDSRLDTGSMISGEHSPIPPDGVDGEEVAGEDRFAVCSKEATP